MTGADGHGPIRVLHIITGLFAGGAETMLERLVMGADASRITHNVVSLLPRGPVGERIERAGVPVFYLEMHPRLPLPHHVRSLRRVVRRVEPDLIQGWMVHGNLASLAAARATNPPRPVIWHILQTVYRLRDEPFATRTLIRLAARLSRRPARIIYNSRTAARQHEALGYDQERTAVIPSGFDLERFRPDPVARADVRRELGVAPETELVGMLARYHRQKDHHTFVTAAGLLATSKPVAFLLAGRGVDPRNDELVGWCRDAGLTDRVLLLGERTDVARLSAALDVAVLSAAYGEGFPNVLGEAMACGVPCVATDVGDTAWIVGETGLVVPPRDPAALAQAVRTILECGAPARRELGNQARARIAAYFPLDTVRETYWRMYAEVGERIGSNPGSNTWHR